jgi:hypothetical protein
MPSARRAVAAKLVKYVLHDENDEEEDSDLEPEDE